MIKQDKKRKQAHLYIIPLGGLGEVGRNMMVLEYRHQVLVIDMGLRMPEEDMPGIDYIIPNTAYLKNSNKKVLGVVITHAHLDHIGAIPYSIHRIGNPPIYASPLAKALILDRQLEFPNQPKIKVIEVRPDSSKRLGPFNIHFFSQNHNIPETLGLFIETPVGNIVYTTDFKFDEHPVNDKPTDFQKLRQLGDKGVLLMFSDSTGAEKQGFSLSEETIFNNLEEIFKKAKGRIIAATFSSHINRIQQLITLSEKYGRKVFLSGRSMERNVEIARNLKYIKSQKGTFVKKEDLSRLPDNRLSVICTGAQGEEGASLMRIANQEYRDLKIKKGDTIIFSSSVIPGNERTVQLLKDELHRQGAYVYHYQMMDIHASGHAQQEELKKMLKLVRPKFFIPIHGQYSMLVHHRELAQEVGIPKKNIVVAENGQVIKLTPNSIKKLSKEVSSSYVMVDGLGVGDVGEVVLRDRQMLARDGMFVIIATVDSQKGEVIGSPDIISRGFIYLREAQELLQETRERVKKIVNQAAGKGKAVNWIHVKNEIREKVGQFLYGKTKRRPMVLPVVIEV